MHGQPHRLAQRQPVRGAQGHVDGDPLGEVHLDRHLQRQEARRQHDLTHVGHRHARWRVDVQPNPDRHRQVVAQRQWQRAAFGGQGVGAAGVDDRDGVEQVLHGPADRRQPLLRQSVAGVGRDRQAQRAQQILPQRRGVLVAGETGAFVGGQGCGEAPQPAGGRGDARDDTVVEPSARISEGPGRQWGVARGGGGLVDQCGQRAWDRQPGPDAAGHRGQDRLGVGRRQVPHQRRHHDLGAWPDVRVQAAPQQRADRVLAPCHVGVLFDRDVQRGVQIGGRLGRRAHAGEGGPHRGVERRGDHGRGVAQRDGVGCLGGAVGGLPGLAEVRRADRDGRSVAGQQLYRRGGQRAVADQAGTAGRGDAQQLVQDACGAGGGDRGQAGVGDPVEGVEVGLGVGGGGDTHPPGERLEPVEPVHRCLLAGAGVGRGARACVGGVVDDVAGGHGVDGDQQVRVDRQTDCARDVSAGVDLGTGREVDGGQQRVQAPARGQRAGEFVVDQAHRGGAAGGAGRQPGPVGERPEHGEPDGAGGVRWHRGVQGFAGAVGVTFGRYAEDRQQEARVIEPRGRPIVGGAVHVDHDRVHAGVVDPHRGRHPGPQRVGEPERNPLSAGKFGRGGDEVCDGLVLVDVAGQVGAQRGRRRDRLGTFQPYHHIAHGPVTDVADGAGHGHQRVAGGGDDVGGDVVDLHAQERDSARLGGRDGGSGGGCDGQQQREDRDEQARGAPHGP